MFDKGLFLEGAFPVVVGSTLIAVEPDEVEAELREMEEELA